MCKIPLWSSNAATQWISMFSCCEYATLTWFPLPLLGLADDKEVRLLLSSVNEQTLMHLASGSQQGGDAVIPSIMEMVHSSFACVSNLCV